MVCTCIIVDDEPPAIKVLQKYVESVSQLRLVATCKNAFEAMEIMSQDHVDLAFLDINMPKLMGTELIKSLKHPPKVIFTSAHEIYALEAFELEAVDYLLKPISMERFLKAVNRFCHLNTLETQVLGINAPFLYFRSDRKMVKVFLEDILFVESFKNYVVIHRENQPPLQVKQTLASIENMLPPKMFLRIHRSYIVSMSKITAYSKNEVEIGTTTLHFGKNYGDAYLKFVAFNNAKM